MHLPVWMRSPVLRLYIWAFSCTLEEAACTDLRTYPNLGEFFRRQLKRGVRPVHTSHCMVSPADGRILQHGVVTPKGIEQVKGVTYSLKGFLGPLDGLLPAHVPSTETVERLKRVSSLHLMTDEAHLKPKSVDIDPLTSSDDLSYLRRLLVHPENVLHYCIIYLAPGDYHRYHSPADWTVFARRHFPGELYSVSPGVARWLQGLFNFNERAVYTGSWRYGFFSMTPVGATNVGSINVYFDEDLTTNKESHEAGTYFDESFFSKNTASPGLKIHKGQAVGDFNLGSTIVLMFEAPANFRFQQKIGQKVKVGQSLGTLI
ncbi:hypothetical protein CAPTEDRAFT_160543 [Capitella teleta]|uniref:phosphatidylserine decarboxylase n=1 Tax=Capitella teleta TaxID=283909 RepID=R7TKI2_CAPTE|nr:hypothetical protein CAPTEDRAFT_160543 [Capitella teleta]|eukprot:ELT94293.1 hypothetical protein CAPTEDRAFT_160543 [Capitella teleta]